MVSLWSSLTCLPLSLSKIIEFKKVGQDAVSMSTANTIPIVLMSRQFIGWSTSSETILVIVASFVTLTFTPFSVPLKVFSEKTSLSLQLKLTVSFEIDIHALRS